MTRRREHAKNEGVRLGPRREDVHQIVYFQRHRDDDSTEPAPGRDFLETIRELGEEYLGRKPEVCSFRNGDGLGCVSSPAKVLDKTLRI